MRWRKQGERYESGGQGGGGNLRKGRSWDLLLSGPMLIAIVLIRFAATSCSHTSSILNSSTSRP